MTMRQWSGCFAVWKQNGADRGLHECIAGTAGYQSVSDARVQLATAISVQRWTTARCGWGRVREYLLFRVRGLNGWYYLCMRERVKQADILSDYLVSAPTSC